MPPRAAMASLVAGLARAPETTKRPQTAGMENTMKKTLIGLSLLALLALSTVASASHGDGCCGGGCCEPQTCCVK